MWKIRLYIVFLFCFILASCTTKPCSRPIHNTALFQKTTFTNIDMWEYDDHFGAVKAFQKSCEKINKMNSNSQISKFTKIGGRVKDWQIVCRNSHHVKNNHGAKRFFEDNFTPYKIKNESGSSVGKFTGYYEIELRGSKKKTKLYQYPVYKTPHNIKSLKGKSKIEHAAINNGSLKGKNLEIAWVDNKARLFFMQIQGSGIIKLSDGCEMRIGYSDENGFPYKHIGPMCKYYTTERLSSATDIMNWIHRNPKLGKKLMEHNPSYVFFQERAAHAGGPVGGQGVPLTPERSIAIDHRLFPYGTPFWIETDLPKTRIYNKEKMDYHRVVIAQDTGGAIRGAVRADIFFGRGNRAEELAGYMNNPGTYYALFPKTVSIPDRYRS